MNDKVILPDETPESCNVKSGDMIIFQFHPNVKDRLEAERQEKDLLKRKEQLKQLVETVREEKEMERVELEREKKHAKREKEQEERIERSEQERIALTRFFGENDEAIIGKNPDNNTSNDELISFIMKKRNWMNDEHFQRIVSYFVDDIFIHRRPELLEVADYMSSYICFIFKKKKDDYDSVKHMRILLKTFFELDDNENQCLTVLRMMATEIKRLQRFYKTTNATTRFESLIERIGIAHTNDSNATFGDQGISHMTLAYISDNKQMIGYLYNHGGKTTTVLEFFEVNFLKNNPELNTPALRLMVLMYIAIEIYEIGIKWTTPINDDDLVAEFDAIKPKSEKKKKKKNTATTISITTTTVQEEGKENDDEDDDGDYSVFAKKPPCIVKQSKKPLVKPIIVDKPKTIVNPTIVKPFVKPFVKPIDRVILKSIENVVKPFVKPFVKPIERPFVKPIERPFVKPIVKPIEKPIEKPVEKPVEKPAVEVAPKLSPRAVKIDYLLQQPPPPAFLGLEYLSKERIQYAIDCVCYLKL